MKLKVFANLIKNSSSNNFNFLENCLPELHFDKILNNIGRYIDDDGNVEIKDHRYEKLPGKYLGKGGFAQCYQFRDLDNGTFVAGKIIDKKTLHKSRTMTKLLYEISIHKSLNHPNIVKFLDFFEDDKNVYIMLQLCRYGDIYNSKPNLIILSLVAT